MTLLTPPRRDHGRYWAIMHFSGRLISLMGFRHTLVYAEQVLLWGLCSSSRCHLDLAPLDKRRSRSACHLGQVGDNNNDSNRLIALLQQAGIDPELCLIEPLSSPGFCNALYNVQYQNQEMIGKLFSRLAQQRMPLQNRHHIDWMASEHGLGPKLFSSTDDGILMERLGADCMDERMVHGSSDWIESVATRLAAFHVMETPSPPNVLWHSMDRMMDIMQDAGAVEEKVARQRESLEPLDLPTVLGHGDLKPSNIVGGESPRFIDLEISGMHYRGFDLAKLFRTDHPTEMSEENFNAFSECYLHALPIPVSPDGKELELLRLEAKLLEPLTWLEAAVFFVCTASMDPENAENWNRLAADRMNSYDQSIKDLDSRINEYRGRR